MLIHCKNHQSDLQNQSHLTVVEALMRVMHEFLMFRAKAQAQEAATVGPLPDTDDAEQQQSTESGSNCS